MEEILKVRNISKKYPGFVLDNISFDIKKGSIMGLIGRNGAGKSTTIKAILNLIHRDSGTISYFGMDFLENEAEIKKRIGYAGGAVDYYKKKKIKKIMNVTRSFYENWNEDAYSRYMKLFELDENKTPGELSEGMKVKLNLAAALSHNAELIILDEPTSGLDPVSRDELLEIFGYLASEGTSILFSTHITSDLEKCADSLTYIRSGKLESTGNMEELLENWKIAGRGETLEEVMINFEREALREKFAE
ncbi:MAG: ABC transporter ATP-binding protein [Lachnospiraceae bacterium]|jgi:ABC-2 type transport system ATP-binding protein